MATQFYHIALHIVIGNWTIIPSKKLHPLTQKRSCFKSTKAMLTWKFKICLT